VDDRVVLAVPAPHGTALVDILRVSVTNEPLDRGALEFDALVRC
jgi:hypothetical protein